MAKRRSSSPSPVTVPDRVAVVYGLDPKKAPCAARFDLTTELDQPSLATAGFHRAEVSAAALGTVLADIPLGTLDPDGLPVIPAVGRTTYDELLAIVISGAVDRAPPDHQVAAPPPVAGPESLWAAIGVGSVVIAREGPDQGWWEARVIRVKGDQLTLRWRDFPDYPEVVRPRLAVALTLHQILS